MTNGRPVWRHFLKVDSVATYIFDGLDDLDVGGEYDDDGDDEAKTVDERNVAHLKQINMTSHGLFLSNIHTIYVCKPIRWL